MVEVGDRIRATGVDPGSLSLGSTPGMSLVENLDGIDEARPGNYAFYDYTQSRLGTCDVSRCAVTVLSSIVSATAGRDSAMRTAGHSSSRRIWGRMIHPITAGCSRTWMEAI